MCSRNTFTVAGLVLYLFFLGRTYGTPIDPYEGQDFYKLLNNPDGRLALSSRLTTADRIAEHGYPVERHSVVTEDGYIIGLFRIPYSHKLQNEQALRPIAFLQHGLSSSSDGWISMGPDDALPFLLADAGFDVWLGNARGTTYSRNHTSRSTEHPYFWRFSWHEIGYYDIAAVIDYVLSANGQNQQGIHYVGHSQGTTVFFVLMSTRPEYNAKIKTAHMLAPVAYMNNLSNSLVRWLGPYLGHYNTYSLLFGSQEFLPYNDFFLALLYNTCRPESRFANFCDGVLYNSNQEGRSNSTASAINAQTHPAGASTDQGLHYLQEQQSGYFRQFDFGKAKNIQVYGTEFPPDYATEQITCQTHLWYGDSDDLAAVTDVLRLAETLPNKVMHHMNDPFWDHGDFATNWEVRKYINDPIIQIMQDFEDQLT
ncbi:lipase 3-like [Scaptodrosophila lebanonensis]|uniref:Lipase n=1 Tax=Drosophila lebanonensis TaxID=7225 RepID=A0A6J2TDS1_DROLE|nr:lipase 3-like [Scaptodrosophila lebanonensis]